jgi:hypothetical protein
MERRKTPRTSVSKLGYVNFEPYNTGGVITDVSTAGLRFHTVAPVQQGGLVRLSLTLGAAKQIEAVGELVWTDSTRQIGGVRFVVLPPAAADQINDWLENSAGANARENGAKSETEVAETIAPLPGISSAELEKLQASGPDGVDEKHEAPKPVLSPIVPPVLPSVPPQNAPLPAPGVEPNLRSAWVPPSARPYSAASSIGPQSSDAPKDDALRGSTLPPYGFVPPGQRNTMPWITHFDPDPPERGSAFVRGLIAAVIVCLLLAPVAWFGLRRYGWQSSSLSPANSVASNPISAPPDAAATNPVLPAPDLPNPGDGNSSTGNPIDAKSMTAANPAPSAEQGSSVQATSAVPNPQATPNPSPVNPKPGAAAQSAQASPAEAKPVTKPEAAGAVPSEPASIARSPIAASGPRDIAPDSLALASQPVAKTPPPAPTPEPENPGEAQLILAWQYLEGQGGKPRDPTTASQFLWSAVEKGNLTAETTLANLYVRGEGVPKNCDQARVLLSAASDKGSAEAKRKLLELDHTGCH